MTSNIQASLAPSVTLKQVVVVSKQPQLHGLLEGMLDDGRYDVVFVESTEHAYSRIRHLGPHLIIVCLDIDDLDGFHVLSMLKLDPLTRNIPVVTCTISRGEDASQHDPIDPPEDDDVFSESPAICMN